MLELIATLIMLVILTQLMPVVDVHKRLNKLERNIAEIINNELKVDRLKRKGIELQNINLKGITYDEQILKIAEEDKEFYNAISSGTYEDIVEEIWDTFQARMGLAYMEGVKAEDIMQGYAKHLKKIENRPR